MKHRFEDSILPPTRKRGIGHVLIVIATIGVIGLMLILGLTGCGALGPKVRSTTTVKNEATGTEAVTVTETPYQAPVDPFDAGLGQAAEAIANLVKP